MDVLFLSPAYPPEMQQFTRGLAQAGARVWGVGDSDPSSFSDALKANLAGYLRVPAILDEDDVIRRLEAWLGDKRPTKVEANWEVVTLLAARLRERWGLPGMSVDTVDGFRDKQLMKERVAAAGLPVPQSVRARTVAGVWAAAQTIGFPLVMKPIAGAGSADTFRCDSPRDLENALAITGHVAEVSLETFITGQEYTFETLSVAGKPVFRSVSMYVPNTLVARQNEWISPIILCLRDLADPEVAGGVSLGDRVLGALDMGTGFTHMEWYRRPNGSVVFGEVACRPPGANMVDLMNYANDIDLFAAWGEAVVHGRVSLPNDRPWNAAIVFKRARGDGRIQRVTGLERFVARHGRWIARLDLLPVGAHRRNWRQTFLSDGNIVVRHPDPQACLNMAREAAATIHLFAG